MKNKRNDPRNWLKFLEDRYACQVSKMWLNKIITDNPKITAKQIIKTKQLRYEFSHWAIMRLTSYLWYPYRPLIDCASPLFAPFFDKLEESIRNKNAQLQKCDRIYSRSSQSNRAYDNYRARLDKYEAAHRRALVRLHKAILIKFINQGGNL